MGTRTYSRRSSTGEVVLTRLGRERAAGRTVAGAGVNSAAAAVENARQVNELISGGNIPSVADVQKEISQVYNEIGDSDRARFAPGSGFTTESYGEVLVINRSVLNNVIQDEASKVVDSYLNGDGTALLVDFSRRWSKPGEVRGRDAYGGVNELVRHLGATQSQITEYITSVLSDTRALRTAEQNGLIEQAAALRDLIRVRAAGFTAKVNTTPNS